MFVFCVTNGETRNDNAPTRLGVECLKLAFAPVERRRAATRLFGAKTNKVVVVSKKIVVCRQSTNI